MAHTDTPWVSVVVPVFNPGPWIRPLLDSLDAQPDAAGSFEALLIDDGSSDGTERLLEHWTASRPWARVVHRPPSGWPSRPRNTGLAQARGDYVYFVDHDDWLTGDALARLRGFAQRTTADVIVGRMTGQGRKVPQVLFRATVDDARPPAQPVQDSMTTHALFRRAFLDTSGIRFDESLRRLEDHLFMAQAYTRARRIAVYSDTPVYVHAERDDGEGAGYRRYRPDEYYPALRRCIDTVVDALPPGPERQAYLARWVRIELVGRLQSDAVRWLPRRERDAFFASVQQVLSAHLPHDAISALSAPWRWPAALAATASADEFYRADDLMTTSPAADRPGSATLTGAVAPAALSHAVQLLGGDEPLPTARAARTPATARRRRTRRRLMELVSRFPGGGLHRALVVWGRTPRLLARRAAAVASIVAPAAAMVLVVSAPGWAFAAAVAGLVLSTWLAVRSLSGGPTALRQTLALGPAVVGTILAPTPPAVAGVAVAGVVIAGAWAADVRARRRDVRAHAGVTGGLFARTGWIAATAACVAAVVAAVDAGVLLG
ncbi:glycosyltransferase family 2 protein [Microbacterium sp. MC2]